ncbi:MAG: response regulator [Synergistetes bacterium]|nr:MAG: Response regulator receiver protein [bacterium 42_11]MBC7331849.1 response regulator [Synergistota bacterium]
MKRSILVIDDSPLVRDLIKQILSREDAEVVGASNGAEALAFLKKNKPDLIFLDIMMPGLDGLSLLREIRKMGHLKGVPIVIVTAIAEKDIIGELKALGVEEVIFKPFSPVQFRTLVNKYIGKQAE